MKLPRTRILVATGIVSVGLVSLSAVLGESKFGWLGLPFWAPGFFAAGIVFPQGIEGKYAILYLTLVCILNFIFTWFAVLILLKMAPRFFARRRESE
jgi:hypothetical protein